MSFDSETNIRVLLITNKDSDNIGDQVIEACDIALLKTAARNLQISENKFTIDSAALSAVSDLYCDTDNPSLLDGLEQRIKKCTFVLFGGAPVFNYQYKNFYKKTSTILTVAAAYKKPVIFSAVGINDPFDIHDKRCASLYKALNNGSVKQLTVRDGYEQALLYTQKADKEVCPSLSPSSLPVKPVSDPAVFTKFVFKRTDTAQAEKKEKKKIGLFVFRAGGFSDNNVSFSRKQQCLFWQDVCEQLESIGYDYELLTSGHFADEANLQYMIDSQYVKKEKCVLCINTPEDLLTRIQTYDGVVSCRLHPSIISYSYGIPSVSLIWNSKVADFYSQIGYPERAISTDTVLKADTVDASFVVRALLRAIDKGVAKDRDYVESVFKTLVEGFAACIGYDKAEYNVFEREELYKELATYSGTTTRAKDQKIERKFRRSYRAYNELLKGQSLSRSKIGQFIYHSGKRPTGFDSSKIDIEAYEFCTLSSQNVEFCYEKHLPNDASEKFLPCVFARKGRVFAGWRVRLRIGENWYWLLDGGGFCLENRLSRYFAKVLQPGDCIPIIHADRIDVVVAEAIWKVAIAGKDQSKQ